MGRKRGVFLSMGSCPPSRPGCLLDVCTLTLPGFLRSHTEWLLAGIPRPVLGLKAQNSFLVGFYITCSFNMLGFDSRKVREVREKKGLRENRKWLPKALEIALRSLAQLLPLPPPKPPPQPCTPTHFTSLIHSHHRRRTSYFVSGFS